MLRGWKAFLLTFGVALLAVLGIVSSKKKSLWPSPPVPREPQRDVFFLKTHKTAGSSVLNLLLRRADSEGLNLALPKEAASHIMGYPRSFSPREHMLNYSQCGLRPNLMALHMRFNETSVKEVMPDDTVYVTDTATSDGRVFLSVRPQTVRDSRLHGSLGFNQMAFDLGVDADGMADRGSVEEISRFVQSVDRCFHLVMIAERFTESLVLLRDLLGWQLDDMVTFKHNMRHHRYPTPDEDAVSILEKANRVDEALYRHFAAKLDRQIEEFGRGRMEDEAAALESRTAFWYKRCVDSIRVSKVAVIEYSPLANVSEVEQRMCRLLTMPEQSFVKEARKRLSALCPQASPPTTTTATPTPERRPR
ncbi:hypothetical protein MTO96_024231 [Rhipicephalus appendiculatus]